MVRLMEEWMQNRIFTMCLDNSLWTVSDDFSELVSLPLDSFFTFSGDFGRAVFRPKTHPRTTKRAATNMGLWQVGADGSY